jgi:hypothetical protein
LKLSLANFSTLSFVLAGWLLAAGCASMVTGRAGTIRLEIVDAKTGQPLSGVSAVWREDLDDLAFGHFQTGPIDLPASNDKGIITISQSHGKMIGRLILAHTGYVKSYGFFSGGSLSLSQEIQPPPFPQDLFVLDDEQTSVEHSGGIFVVRMPK